MKIRKIKFAEIPDWAVAERPSLENLLTAVSLTGNVDTWIRLSAEAQRKLIGFPVFGKQQFKVDVFNRVKVVRSVCFGTDREIATFTHYEINRAVGLGKVLRPGY